MFFLLDKTIKMVDFPASYVTFGDENPFISEPLILLGNDEGDGGYQLPGKKQQGLPGWKKNVWVKQIFGKKIHVIFLIETSKHVKIIAVLSSSSYYELHFISKNNCASVNDRYPRT